MGKFVMKRVPTGFNFYLKAVNGEPIGTSEVYNSREACLNGVESVMKYASLAHIEDQTVDGHKKEKCPKFEVYHDKAGAFRFRLLAVNGQEILASQAYTAKASCLNGIRSVVDNAPTAEIEEIKDQS